MTQVVNGARRKLSRAKAFDNPVNNWWKRGAQRVIFGLVLTRSDLI